MTQQQALDWIKGGWKSDPKVTTINGALGIDVDNYFGHQCKDFANAYAVWLGHPLTAGDAITAWNVPQDPWYAKLPNTPDLVFQPGDIFVMSPNHIGLVIEGANTSQFTSVDQNWFNSNSTVGSPPALVNHNYQHMLGVLRPQFNQGEIMIDKDGVELLYEYGLFRVADHPGADGWVGQPYKDVVTALLGSAEHKAVQDKLSNYDAQVSAISKLTSEASTKDALIEKLQSQLANPPTNAIPIPSGFVAWLKNLLGIK